MKADGPRLDGAATSAGMEDICAEGGWWAGQKYKPRHPGPRGSGELGEDHYNQQFYLAG